MFSVVYVKVTRPPVVDIRGLPYNEATERAEDLGRATRKLTHSGLAVPGISIQVISDDDLIKLREIEAGGLRFHGIRVFYQVNAE